MCILILLRGIQRDHPIVVGANRDERTDRKAAPPGLFVGRSHRMLSPRDRLQGGTWLSVDDRGWFAGLTNLAGVPPVPGAPSRGHLPHACLDEPDLDRAVGRVRSMVVEAPHSAFQLVLCDGERTLVLRHRAGSLAVLDWTDPVLVVTNEHAPGELSLRGLDHALAVPGGVDVRLDALQALLADRGGPDAHAVCKHGTEYGTVSSSLVAVPAGAPSRLTWRYAAGPPDSTPYKNYGNLGRRLLPEDPA
jgi:hypothetical protein